MSGATKLSGLLASIHDTFRVVPIVDRAILRYKISCIDPAGSVAQTRPFEAGSPSVPRPAEADVDVRDTTERALLNR